METDDDVLSEFRRRIFGEWLPDFCHDPRRNYGLDGFKPKSIKIVASDARDFMRALKHEVVSNTGGGRYRAARSSAIECIFWEGRRASIPRSVTLWIEPVITIAAMARLHLDWGWPKEMLGMQSKSYEFDLVAYRSVGDHCAAIAGEVKKSLVELDKMIRHLEDFARSGIPEPSVLPVDLRAVVSLR